jgi:hypothetical protein
MDFVLLKVELIACMQLDISGIVVHVKPAALVNGKVRRMHATLTSGEKVIRFWPHIMLLNVEDTLQVRE